MVSFKKIIILVLFAIWLILSSYILKAGGFTFYNIFVIIASGIIIFVPLIRKYWNKENKETK